MKMKNTQKGFSLIELIIVVLVIAIIALIAIPNLQAAKRASNEAATISSLRTLTSAQATYKAGKDTFGTLSELHTEGLIDEVLGCGTPPCLKTGYKYTATPLAALPDFLWDAYADPQFDTGIGATGKRYFYTNESLVIYANVGSQPVVDGSRKVTTGTPIGD